MTASCVPSQGRTRCPLLAVVLLLASLLPTVAAAEDWYVLLAPNASIPINLMTTYYGPSPSLGAGLGNDWGAYRIRLIVAYTALRSTVSALPETTKYIDDPATPDDYDRTWVPITWAKDLGGTVHHGSLAAEIVIPAAFGVRRLYLIGGVGAGLRRLSEGRVFEEEVLGENRFLVKVRVRKGIGEPTLDLTGRLGVGLGLWETPRWSVLVETRYQASFAAINPPGISLDLRVDELIQVGLVFTYDLRSYRHR